MGFWEIAFLVWAAGACVFAFSVAWDEGMGAWNGLTMISICLWFVIVSGIAGRKLRARLER